MVRIYLHIILTRLFGLAVLLFYGFFLMAGLYHRLIETHDFKILAYPLHLLLFFMLAIWSINQILFDGDPIGKIVGRDDMKSELELAKSEAQANLQKLIRQVEEGIDAAHVKVHCPSLGEESEPVWCYVHFYREGRFNVQLNNENMDASVPNGGRFFVPTEAVEDWKIVQDDGKIQGEFSTVAMLDYWKRIGKPYSPRMKKQRAQLLDAGPAA